MLEPQLPLPARDTITYGSSTVMCVSQTATQCSSGIHNTAASSKAWLQPLTITHGLTSPPPPPAPRPFPLAAPALTVYSLESQVAQCIWGHTHDIPPCSPVCPAPLSCVPPRRALPCTPCKDGLHNAVGVTPVIDEASNIALTHTTTAQHNSTHVPTQSVNMAAAHSYCWYTTGAAAAVTVKWFDLRWRLLLRHARSAACLLPAQPWGSKPQPLKPSSLTQSNWGTEHRKNPTPLLCSP